MVQRCRVRKIFSSTKKHACFFRTTAFFRSMVIQAMVSLRWCHGYCHTPNKFLCQWGEPLLLTIAHIGINMSRSAFATLSSVYFPATLSACQAQAQQHDHPGGKTAPSRTKKMPTWCPRRAAARPTAGLWQLPQAAGRRHDQPAGSSLPSWCCKSTPRPRGTLALRPALPAAHGGHQLENRLRGGSPAGRDRSPSSRHQAKATLRQGQVGDPSSTGRPSTPRKSANVDRAAESWAPAYSAVTDGGAFREDSCIGSNKRVAESSNNQELASPQARANADAAGAGRRTNQPPPTIPRHAARALGAGVVHFLAQPASSLCCRACLARSRLSGCFCAEPSEYVWHDGGGAARCPASSRGG